MRKLVSMLLIMLVAFGVVFAETITFEASKDNHVYAVNLKATVESSIKDPDEEGGNTQKPDTIVYDGLALKVGIDLSGADRTMGSAYASGDLVGLASYPETNALSASLTPDDTEGVSNLIFYVAASSDMSPEERKSMTVTFASDGWEYKKKAEDGSALDLSALDIDNSIDFASTTRTTAEDGLTASVSAGVVTVTAEPSSRTSKDGASSFLYVAKTTASWEKSDKYPAGDYTASITVTVAAV